MRAAASAAACAAACALLAACAAIERVVPESMRPAVAQAASTIQAPATELVAYLARLRGMNERALADFGITLKDFYLRAAKVHR